MNKVELTPAKLADIKKKAEGAKDVKWPTIEQFPQHEEYPAAELIAAADPATVLALVEEIEFLRRTSMIKTELLGKFMLKTERKRGRAVSDYYYIACDKCKKRVEFYAVRFPASVAFMKHYADIPRFIESHIGCGTPKVVSEHDEEFSYDEEFDRDDGSEPWQ